MAVAFGQSSGKVRSHAALRKALTYNLLPFLTATRDSEHTNDSDSGRLVFAEVAWGGGITTRLLLPGLSSFYDDPFFE